jgi:hypothetical protein
MVCKSHNASSAMKILKPCRLESTCRHYAVRLIKTLKRACSETWETLSNLGSEKLHTIEGNVVKPRNTGIADLMCGKVAKLKYSTDSIN